MNTERTRISESQAAIRVFAGIGTAIFLIVASAFACVVSMAMLCLLTVLAMDGGKTSGGNLEFALYLAVQFGLIGALPVSLAVLLSPSRHRLAVISIGALVCSVAGGLCFWHLMHLLSNS